LRFFEKSLMKETGTDKSPASSIMILPCTQVITKPDVIYVIAIIPEDGVFQLTKIFGPVPAEFQSTGHTRVWRNQWSVEAQIVGRFLFVAITASCVELRIA